MTRAILIVDDSRTARMFIKQCLEIAGYDDYVFHEAGNGEEALAQLQARGDICLVVTDINMPVKDGISLVKDMQLLPNLRDLAVVVISSTQNAARTEELQKLGVRLVLAKPLHLPLVAQRLKDLKQALGN